ncbi:MAG: N-acetylmuramic acid 6-phosphate etherase [Candidatus Obscuribacterales bacterium]
MSQTAEFKRMMTEERNPRTMDLDVLETQDLVERIQTEDREIVNCVQQCIPQISKAVDVAAERLQREGRMIYFGAGTSGRLGVLDANECPPTFGVDGHVVQAYIAGGREAMFRAFENAEDSTELGTADAAAAELTERDVVVGISASGRTPYVVAAIKAAKAAGCATVCIVNNPNSELETISDISIVALVGPEAITGSTRMKSGTAQKMILNLLSTCTMVKLGKVYENLMIDLKPTNEKLRERALSIICALCEVPRHVAEGSLVASNNRAKTAILMIKRKLGRAQAEQLIARSSNSLRRALTAEIN